MSRRWQQRELMLSLDDGGAPPLVYRSRSEGPWGPLHFTDALSPAPLLPWKAAAVSCCPCCCWDNYLALCCSAALLDQPICFDCNCQHVRLKGLMTAHRRSCWQMLVCSTFLTHATPSSHSGWQV